MKTEIRRGLILAAVCLSTLNSQLSTFADLSITATPGFVFSETSGGRPTVANLNRALNMTYQVSGTIGGTNAGLAAGSITAAHLSASVGGSNILVTTSGLVVSNNAIGPNQLSTAAAGVGLTGGAGAALSVNVDTSTITFAGTNLTLATGGIGNVNISANAAIAVSKLEQSTNTILGAGTNGVNVALTLGPGLAILGSTLVRTQVVISGVAVLTASSCITNAHNLGLQPSWVRTVLVCGTADRGYQPGEEVDLLTMQNGSGDYIATVAADTNNLYLCAFGHSSSNWQVRRRDSPGAGGAITASSWSIKFYVRP